MEAIPRILVVEDDPQYVVFITDLLKYMGYQVLIARNGKEGLEKTRGEKPNLVVLDVMMPEMDGYEVCHRLKTDPETRQIPVLMLTAKGQLLDRVKGINTGANAYLPKPYEKAEFEALVRSLLKCSAYVLADSHSSFTLSISILKNQIGIRAGGNITLRAMIEGASNINVDRYSRLGGKAYGLEWRFDSKDSGQQLYKEIFTIHPEVLGTYQHALGGVGEKGKLHLVFESARDFLRVPLEFLFSDVSGGEDYLVLRHPLSRAFTDVRTNRVSISPDFLMGLCIKGEGLRVLLIGSNTSPDIPSVDQEIKALSASLQALFEGKGISLQVDTLPSVSATYEGVRKKLRNCRYHIVHYAGHGLYDPESPEKSCLFFWEKENRQGSVKRLPASELQILLGDSDLRFVYLSCCLGTKTGEPSDLLDDNFLGIADGIVHAGIPSVLGFRWPVSDLGAKELALAFYESLASQGQIDTALLEARREIAARDRDDITWLSPVLIMQG